MKTHTQESKCTPGPWKVMACPNHKGKHPFHDRRWIATHDAEVEQSEFVPMDWGLEKGSLICQMRDGPEGNAALIAAAPELLAVAKESADMLKGNPSCKAIESVICALQLAIARAEGRDAK